MPGDDTAFLPFNRDTHNPIIPGRFASSYLWDDFADEEGQTQPGILRADLLLLLIQNYLHSERDEKTGRDASSSRVSTSSRRCASCWPTPRSTAAAGIT